jgi:hypothetical protein
MKKYILIVYLLAFIGIHGYATASEVQIISSDYRIWGDWTEKWYSHLDTLTYSNSGSFNISDITGAPIYNNVQSTPYGLNGSNSYIESFGLGISTNSYPWASYAKHQIEVIKNTSIYTYADAKWVFRPYGESLRLVLNGKYQYNYYGYEQALEITLRDMTDGTNLLLIKAQDLDWWSYFSETYELDLNPAHEYVLRLYGWTAAYDAKYANVSVEAELVASPEPSTFVLLLLALAMISVMIIRNSCMRLRNSRGEDIAHH